MDSTQIKFIKGAWATVVRGGTQGVSVKEKHSVTLYGIASRKLAASVGDYIVVRPRNGCMYHVFRIDALYEATKLGRLKQREAAIMLAALSGDTR